MEKNTVDARGLTCPLPVVNTKKAVENMKTGGVLTVLVDNEIAVQNLKKFAKQKGYEAFEDKKAEKEYEVTIRVPEKDLVSVIEKKEETIVCSTNHRSKGMVVVLSGNVMGIGEEKLGKTLMKAFVFALTRQDVLPETILCYNTGAYLTCEGADTLEDLCALEAEGVQILTCGTCLDYYGIKEKLKVGSITNMYEIVETMEKAAAIVRP